MWTAIIGGAIFAAARGNRVRYVWILGAYLLISVLHGAFDSINGITGYVVVSMIGLVPLVWLWLRADGRGGVLPRGSSTADGPCPLTEIAPAVR